jgi:hypothetical protein
MPDFIHSRMEDAPQSWGDAFAALPMETPTRDVWASVARTLDARPTRARAARREHRTNWMIGVASAAVLALAVWAPLARWLQPAQTVPSSALASKAAGTLGPAAPVVAVDRGTAAASARPDGAVMPDTQPDASEPTRITAKRAPDATIAASHPRQKSARRAPSQLAISSPVAPAESDATTPPATQDSPATTAIARAETDRLLQLQAQSAQLEALVAMARDDSTGSASGTLLTSELDANIAAIDAALSQVEVSAEQRTTLWQQRVEALQQLAGVETTERWLASQGALYDAALVSVD